MTSSGIATFAVTDEQRPAVLAGLESLGFLFDKPRTDDRILLDTFDGRLHAAGLRLVLRVGNRSELVLSGTTTISATVTVTSVPRFASDLPPGPFRARLAQVVDVRALLPVMSMTATHTMAALRDGLGKTVAIADLAEHFSVDGSVTELPLTIEIAEVAGYAKHAGVAVATLERLGLRRLHTDTIAAVAAGAGVDLAGHVDSATVPLDPQMAAVDGFRAVLANLAHTLALTWQGTIDEIDTEFLHDLRVAVRRSRAVLSHGKNVMPASFVDYAAARFAELGSLTSRARDLDVYLIEWDSYVEPLGAQVAGALAPAYAVLHRRCRAAHDALVAEMRSGQVADLMSTWQAWMREPLRDQPGVHGQRPLGPFVARRIRKAHAVLVERGRLVGQASPPSQVHDLRKDAKKLRYLLECFGSLLSDKPRTSFVRRLKALQDNLGEYQDTEVHADELADVASELHRDHAASETFLAIGQLIGLLNLRRGAAREEFAGRFAAYDSKTTRRLLDEALAAIER